ncbi:MAG: hypothetical protein LLG00_15155 [Planctomycetaceae bacterium]|nr:hypothetical protein [Planctomycetaceae bacterium]
MIQPPMILRGGAPEQTPMHSRWYNIAVVALWLATMTWLVKEKVLPQLLIGERPSNLDVLKAQQDLPPVGWHISMDRRRLGWALTETALQPNGLTEIHNRVHLQRLPLEKMAPQWLRPFFKLLGKPTESLQLESLDARTILTIDGLGSLLRIDSAVQIEPLGETITVRGLVEGGKLKLAVTGGGLTLAHEVPMPPEAMLNDMLSPQSKLPGLHDGQRWSVPLYNPIAASISPVELIFVAVEGSDPKVWAGGQFHTWRVVYRSDSRGVSSRDGDVRGIAWVRYNGTIIEQQVRLGDSTLNFVRLTRAEAAELVRKIGDQWWNIENQPAKIPDDD